MREPIQGAEIQALVIILHPFFDPRIFYDRDILLNYYDNLSLLKRYFESKEELKRALLIVQSELLEFFNKSEIEFSVPGSFETLDKKNEFVEDVLADHCFLEAMFCRYPTPAYLCVKPGESYGHVFNREYISRHVFTSGKFGFDRDRRELQEFAKLILGRLLVMPHFDSVRRLVREECQSAFQRTGESLVVVKLPPFENDGTQLLLTNMVDVVRGKPCLSSKEVSWFEQALMIFHIESMLSGDFFDKCYLFHLIVSMLMVCYSGASSYLALPLLSLFVLLQSCAHSQLIKKLNWLQKAFFMLIPTFNLWFKFYFLDDESRVLHLHTDALYPFTHDENLAHMGAKNCTANLMFEFFKHVMLFLCVYTGGVGNSKGLETKILFAISLFALIFISLAWFALMEHEKEVVSRCLHPFLLMYVASIFCFISAFTFAFKGCFLDLPFNDMTPARKACLLSKSALFVLFPMLVLWCLDLFKFESDIAMLETMVRIFDLMAPLFFTIDYSRQIHVKSLIRLSGNSPGSFWSNPQEGSAAGAGGPEPTVRQRR